MNAELVEIQSPQPVSNIRLLVVDDEPRILASLEALLKHKHYQVDTALGGKLAFQKLVQNDYDLVLLDLNMGDVDGFAVMAYMADHGINAATVVVSGEKTFEAVHKALRMGASDYVKKPYSTEELFSTIDSTLHKKYRRVDGLASIVGNSSEDAATKEKLWKSNELFNQAEQLGKMGHWEWDEITNRYISVSKQYASLFGITVEQMLEKVGDEDDINLVCEDDRARYKEVTDTAWESKQGWDIEYRRFDKAGESVYLHEIGEPVLDEHGTIIMTIGTVQDITERKQAEEKLERIAHYDVLTDLPNRVLLADRLNQAMVQCQRRNQSLAVAYLDLDGFKAVNDSHGHDTGDKLLVALSQRMKEALREGDTLARIGGDEFVAVMVDLEKIEDTELVLERLLKAAADPVTVGNAVMYISASIGVTFYPQDSADADQLMRNADQAMYISKQTGKNRYHLFDTTKGT